MQRVAVLLIAVLACSITLAQEIHRPAWAVGDWCEYASEGIGVSRQRHEVVEVTPDGGWAIRITDASRAPIRVFDANGHTLRRGQREHRLISSSGPLYPLGANSRGRTHKESYPHNSRAGVTVEVTSEITAVEPEKINVPAGAFDTLRVRSVSHYRYSDSGRNHANQFVDTVWYALDPKIRFPVQLAFVDYGSARSEITRRLSACGSSPPPK